MATQLVPSMSVAMMLSNKMYFSFGANTAGFNRAMQYMIIYLEWKNRKIN